VSQTAVAEAREAPSGAETAFDRLYRSNRDDVYAYVAGLLRDGPAAEEVTATAFERAYRRRRHFDPGRGEPRAWLFGIARNELRRRGRQAELAAEPEDVDGVHDEGQLLGQLNTFDSSGGDAEAIEEAGGAASVETEESSSAEAVPAAPPADSGTRSSKSAGGGRDLEGLRPVHVADGIVLHSSVQSGSKGATGATFALLIPSAKVNNALAQISSIAEVRERHDATNDITAPTVGAAEELADSNASIESLLKEPGNAETEAERESVEARLREERHRHAAIRASLDHLHERASMSEVTVRIVTGKGAGLTPAGQGSGSDGGWGIGDALHDAGHILTIAAGVVLIGLGVLALIALLIWTANRFRLRRLRERTLG
jgi:RNA polymerase sigma factor (sigma-70 family)